MLLIFFLNIYIIEGDLSPVDQIQKQKKKRKKNRGGKRKKKEKKRRRKKRKIKTERKRERERGKYSTLRTAVYSNCVMKLSLF